MYRGALVGVVVPAFNEEGFVGRVIETAPAYVDRVYAIDDGSTDGTWTEIVEAARTVNASSIDDTVVFEDRVVPIRHESNGGVGRSIKDGYRRALADGIDVVAVMAGDGQMDPDQLDRLLDPVVSGEADYAKGDRLSNESDRTAMTRWRLFGNTLLTGLTRVATGYWSVTDPQNGYTAISAAAIDAIDLDDVYEDYGFCNDLLVWLNAAGMRVVDVEMPAIYGDEESTIRYSTFVPKLSALLAWRFVWRLGVSYGPFRAPRPSEGIDPSADHRRPLFVEDDGETLREEAKEV